MKIINIQLHYQLPNSAIVFGQIIFIQMRPPTELFAVSTAALTHTHTHSGNFILSVSTI